MGFLWMGSKKDKNQETISCASCDKIVLKDRAVAISTTRFESQERGWLGASSHKTTTSSSHYCQECDPGYITKIVLPDGDCRYYWYGYADVHGRNRHGWHEVV